MTNANAPRFIGLFTEEGLDQICSTSEEAAREKRDLRDMGCRVHQYEASDETTLYDIDSRMRDGLTFTRSRALVESGHGPAPKNAPEKAVSELIDLTPTWGQIMPGLIAALESGTPEGRHIARQELTRLAAEVDAANGKARSLSAAVNPDAPKRPSRAALRAMAEDADARPIARELAAMGLAAVSTDSGAFPLYAFRDGRPICPDELDSMIYEIV